MALCVSPTDQKIFSLLLLLFSCLVVVVDNSLYGRTKESYRRRVYIPPPPPFSTQMMYCTGTFGDPKNNAKKVVIYVPCFLFSCAGITTTYTRNNHFFTRMTMVYAVALITGGHQRESIFKHWTRLKFTNKSMTIEKKFGFCWSEIRENIAFRIYYWSIIPIVTNFLCQFWLDGLNRWIGK